MPAPIKIDWENWFESTWVNPVERVFKACDEYETKAGTGGETIEVKLF